MIEINLIPDIKAEFLRAQATKRIVVIVSSLVSAVFVSITILLFLYVNVVQGGEINGNDDRIAELHEEYTNLEDISKILTVDTQLRQLPVLHSDSPAVTRFPDFFSKLIPNNITLSSALFQFDSNELLLEGTAKDVRTVNQFADTLKNAVYAVQGGDEVRRVFTLVVLGEINTTPAERDTDDDKNNNATYELRVVFDEAIFDSDNIVILSIPKSSSDELELLRPEDLITIDQLIETEPRTDDLFDEPPEAEAENGN